jgi:hypothetical protein
MLIQNPVMDQYHHHMYAYDSYQNAPINQMQTSDYMIPMHAIEPHMISPTIQSGRKEYGIPIQSTQDIYGSFEDNENNYRDQMNKKLSDNQFRINSNIRPPEGDTICNFITIILSL